MSTVSRRILFSLLAIGLTACLCLGILGVSGIYVLFTRPFFSIPTQTLEASTTPTRIVALLETPTETPFVETPTRRPEVTSTPSPEKTSQAPTKSPTLAPLPPEIARQMDKIEQQVVNIRGLQSENPVPRKILTREELEQRVIDDFFKDTTPEETRDDAIELAAFGLLKPDYDLYQLMIDLYSEQVAGFYDDDEKTMYVVQETGFTGVERLTYSHEYTHALQDQNYDIQNGLNVNDEACDKDSERCGAIRALMEGDATVVELDWLTTSATSQDMADIQEFYSNYTSPVYDSTPAFLQQDFLFPYVQGKDFVESLIDKGGWEAVDQAYMDPPVSTEQILHPENYPNDAPIKVVLPDFLPILGEGWREVERNTMGEWYTYLTLAFGDNPAARLDDQEAKNAAEGWGGDEYLVYYNDDNATSAMVLKYEWDNDREARQFNQAFKSYASNRFGKPVVDSPGLIGWEASEGYTAFHSSGNQSTWILAPDAATAEALWVALQAAG